jgi:hypothetical protein
MNPHDLDIFIIAFLLGMLVGVLSVTCFLNKP